MARILIGCEFSGRVREALRARGHDAVSCDFRPTEIEGPHIQIIQPWQFGDGASKNTCLWLKGFPKLLPTKLAYLRMVMTGEHVGKLRWANQTDSGQNCLPPSEDRAKIRSTTYQGVADAIGDQWGAFLQQLEIAA